jgi:hypothetical protein
MAGEESRGRDRCAKAWWGRLGEVAHRLEWLVWAVHGVDWCGRCDEAW